HPCTLAERHCQCIAGHQYVAPERFAREKDAAREPERRIEVALKRGFERPEADPEVAQQPPCDRTVERLRRLQRLAAAVADDGAAIDRELVTLGVAAEIVMVVEDEDARVLARCAAVEPRRRKPADAAADHDEVIAFLNGQALDRIAPPFAGE